jgi:hypothetical protein
MYQSLLVDSFRDLRVQLANNASYLDRYRDLAASIIQPLDNHYWQNEQDLSRVVLLGSWTRGTAVAGISDYNIAYELPNRFMPDRTDGIPGHGNSNLQSFYNRLITLFPNAKYREYSHSVGIPLDKGIVIDVMPYFRMKSGEMGYPDETFAGSLRRIDPIVACDAIYRLDSIERENFLLVCRIARIWRKVHSVPISGLLIDVLALEFISRAVHRLKPPKYQDCLLRDFFSFMAEQEKSRKIWTIAGSDQPIRRTGAFEESAGLAHSIVQYAIEQAANGQEKSACAIWRYLLGEYYPAY